MHLHVQTLRKSQDDWEMFHHWGQDWQEKGGGGSVAGELCERGHQQTQQDGDAERGDALQRYESIPQPRRKARFLDAANEKPNQWEKHYSTYKVWEASKECSAEYISKEYTQQWFNTADIVLCSKKHVDPHWNLGFCKMFYCKMDRWSDDWPHCHGPMHSLHQEAGVCSKASFRGQCPRWAEV